MNNLLKESRKLLKNKRSYAGINSDSMTSSQTDDDRSMTVKNITPDKHSMAVRKIDGITGALTATDYKNPQKIAVPVLTPDRKSKRQNGRRFKENNEPMFTLTAQDRHGVMIFDGREYYIRKLTPKECFRLQGFTDEQFERAEAVNSNSQLYKQAGNAVTVNVALEIGKIILKQDELMRTDNKGEKNEQNNGSRIDGTGSY